MKKENKVVDTQQQKNKGGYGLLSLMAMIIGIVIGSGIFAKNAGLITSAGSSLMVAITWIVGALLIITLVIAFLEIISITEIAGEQSTLANWGKRLVGVKFGKFLGIYFTLIYFPIIMAALFQFATDSFLHTISYAITDLHDDSWYNSLTDSAITFEGTVVAIAFVFLIIIMAINAISVAPGKYFQNLGTMIKTIPLFTMIILFFVMLGSSDGIHFASNQDLIDNGIIGTDSNPLDGGFSASLKAIMMTMPAVLFAFDGFLIAGALSKEGKKPTTFRTAFVLSMITIIVIYLLYSMSVLGLGDVTNDAHGKYGSLSNAIYSTFDEDVAKIVDPVATGIITISMLTGVSGCSIASYRLLGDLSVNNIIKDADGKILEKNKAGVNTSGAVIMIGLTMMWFFLGVTFDSILVSQNPENGALNIVGFSSDMIIIWAYFVYTIVIIGAMINRFTHKQLVHKKLLFWPASIVAVLLTFVITAIFAWQILFPPNGDTSNIIWQAKMLYTIIFFAMIIIVYLFLGLGTGKMTGHAEVPEKIIEKANNGNQKAIALIAAFHRKNEFAAAYYGVTVEELESEREEIHKKVEMEKEMIAQHNASSKSNKESKKSKKLSKTRESEELDQSTEEDSKTKKIAPKSH